VRLERQRARLFSAAAAVFARHGYADASAAAIASKAGMSKATFYEHFANKEECLLALFDEAASRVGDALAASASTRVHTFLTIVERFPDEAQTMLVEIVGAGPVAAQRRDDVMRAIARRLYETRAADEGPGYASEHDAFAVVGAVVELVSRQLRRGEPETLAELEPVIERLVAGLLR
jgi:AcrR family transcriptional regulator